MARCSRLFGGRLKDSWLLDLEVVEVVDLAAPLRSIRFASPDLVGFEWRAGQDVMFDVPGTDPPLRRRYTIRRSDPGRGTLDIEVVLHGDGPFARWAADATAGDRIDGIGPRGVVTLRDDADRHLVIGDESAITVTYALCEALDLGVSAVAVLAVEDGEAPLALAAPTGAEVLWTTPHDLPGRLATVALTEGTAVYVNGERSLVRAARDILVGRGVPAERIAVKPYWRRDQPNAGHGEPARD